MVKSPLASGLSVNFVTIRMVFIEARKTHDGNILFPQQIRYS